MGTKMPLPGVYRCDRIRKNNGIWEYFFAIINGDNDEYVILNITGDGTEYEQGKFYEVPVFKKAFPH
jgi:hypothetical protein